MRHTPIGNRPPQSVALVGRCRVEKVARWHASSHRLATTACTLAREVCHERRIVRLPVPRASLASLERCARPRMRRLADDRGALARRGRQSQGRRRRLQPRLGPGRRIDGCRRRRGRSGGRHDDRGLRADPAERPLDEPLRGLVERDSHRPEVLSNRGLAPGVVARDGACRPRDQHLRRKQQRDRLPGHDRSGDAQGPGHVRHHPAGQRRCRQHRRPDDRRLVDGSRRARQRAVRRHGRIRPSGRARRP